MTHTRLVFDPDSTFLLHSFLATLRRIVTMALPEKYPEYVNQTGSFRHEQSEVTLLISSDLATVEKVMRANPTTFALYFPQILHLRHNKSIESRLAQDIQQWPFFQFFPTNLQQLTINASRLCSFNSTLSYERRVLLHHHVAWVFLMDDVTEKLPLYGLHDTAGKLYLDNLKSIINGDETQDLVEFIELCPRDVIDAAILAQKVLSEDLMPLKKTLLTPQHARLCVDLLLQFLDFEYKEGQKFCTEATSQEVLQTRAVTVGGLLPMALAMNSEQAGQCTADNMEMMQASVLMVLMNDIIGLYKDLEAVEQRNDGSAYLNLVRVGMREKNLNEKDALRLYLEKLNKLSWSAEFYQSASPCLRQGLQLECLKLAFNYLDYHLFGIMGKPNNRYGWKFESRM
ncbi:hypothetical protein NQ176_g1531 [Zarea fungicola]|uniref:Uncharacterized protein n=1 Tax=Zarea fungicola TaxID=93591 RepID=A0ACC1NTG9_9HYPO|nr:hypothetical protein NQ176_g1531 [Lecanicillium fungicola]